MLFGFPTGRKIPIPLLCFDELWLDHIISLRCCVFSVPPYRSKGLCNTSDFKPWEVESVVWKPEGCWFDSLLLLDLDFEVLLSKMPNCFHDGCGFAQFTPPFVGWEFEAKIQNIQCLSGPRVKHCTNVVDGP